MFGRSVPTIGLGTSISVFRKKAMKSRTILFIERTPFPPATEKLLIVKIFSDLALTILKNNFVNYPSESERNTEFVVLL